MPHYSLTVAATAAVVTVVATAAAVVVVATVVAAAATVGFSLRRCGFCNQHLIPRRWLRWWWLRWRFRYVSWREDTRGPVANFVIRW